MAHIDETTGEFSMLQRLSNEVQWAWKNTLVPFTVAEVVGSLALAITTRHPEALIITAHGLYETAVEVAT